VAIRSVTCNYHEKKLRSFRRSEVAASAIHSTTIPGILRKPWWHVACSHRAVLTYMRLTGLKKGLLLNFARPVLREGIKRFVV
jgi:hypothetical protein